MIELLITQETGNEVAVLVHIPWPSASQAHVLHQIDEKTPFLLFEIPPQCVEHKLADDSLVDELVPVRFECVTLRIQIAIRLIGECLKSALKALDDIPKQESGVHHWREAIVFFMCQ